MEIDLDLINEYFKKLAAAHLLLLHDLLESLKQESLKGTDYYGKIDFHFNEAGHGAVADFLLQKVLPFFQVKLSEKQ